MRAVLANLPEVLVHTSRSVPWNHAGGRPPVRPASRSLCTSPVAHLTLPCEDEECESGLLRSWGSIFLFLYIWSGFFFCLYLHVNILDGKNDRLLAPSQFALHIPSLPILLKKKKKMSSFMEEISLSWLWFKKKSPKKLFHAPQSSNKSKYTWFLL